MPHTPGVPVFIYPFVDNMLGATVGLRKDDEASCHDTPKAILPLTRQNWTPVNPAPISQRRNALHHSRTSMVVPLIVTARLLLACGSHERNK